VAVTRSSFVVATVLAELDTVRWTLGALLALLAASSLQAQGLSVHSQSGCALARNSTGVADPCGDGSAIFYNPAAIASQRGVASAGLAALYSTSTFLFDDTRESFDSRQGTVLAPHAWLAVPLTPRVAVGFGMWAPYGLTTAWPLRFDGRFDGYDNSLRGIYLQPTVAGEVIPERLAIGGGVAVVAGSVAVRRRTDLARTVIPGTDLHFSDIGVPDGTDFADARLEADDWSATFHLGVQVHGSDRWSFGLRYLHTAHLDLTGRAYFTQLNTGFRLPAGNPFGLPAGTPIDVVLAPQFAPDGALVDQQLTTDLTLPNQIVAGVRFLATPTSRLFFDYQWTGWSHFDRSVLSFQIAPADTLFLDYSNTSTLRFAVEHSLRDGLALRGGILHNTAAAPPVTVNPLLPEARRTSFAGGAGYRLAERINADVGFELLLQDERRGRVRPRTNRRQTAAELNEGRYSAHGLFGSLTLSYFLSREGS
jgi:long-chain fatty acid transport protein